MASLFEKYLGKQIPMHERLFYMATFMSGISALLFAAITPFLQVDYYTVILFCLMSFTCVLFFFLERFFRKTDIFSLLFLFINNMILLPLILYFSDGVTVEVPLYMLIGLTYSIVLLKGKLRIVYIIIQLIVDILTSFYCFLYRYRGDSSLGVATSSDLMRLELAIACSGILCGTIIAYRNSQLHKEMLEREEANAQAEKVSYAKDMFLVNVSHEIRTPLNAIIGTTDLLLDSTAPNHVREVAFNISNSSHALLSITTDLLDFSRMNIDSLVPENAEFDISLMLNDIINLMSVRLLDSNVEFMVDINPLLPKFMIGDSGKIRQIIINILSNAIKYTKEGHMHFFVDFEESDSNQIKLLVKVQDTGIGIKPENIEKIFEPYNRSGGEATDRIIEGNGLGLSLCRKLADAMNGSIRAESVYGEGSTFFFDALLSVSEKSSEHVGDVKRSDINIIFFIDNSNDRAKLLDMSEKMNISCHEAECEEEFVYACSENNYDYMFLDTTAYERLKKAINEAGTNWKKIIVISGWNYSYSGEPFEFVLTRPLSCLNFADVINDNKSLSVRKQIFNGKLNLKNLTIMVVDDNLINLSVAAGLLERYEPNVITAASGIEAINTIQSEDIDLVLLDYMMPDMDGIDTLKAIRALDGDKYKKVPVIALTANVVSGAREMFLDAAFDDYLSKPIEIDKLEKALAEHLPEEKIKYSI